MIDSFYFKRFLMVLVFNDRPVKETQFVTLWCDICSAVSSATKDVHLQ
jgi:hypothetical protein